MCHTNIVFLLLMVNHERVMFLLFCNIFFSQFLSVDL